jgi:TM2 domain-containing membrane protein YozV
MKMNTAPSIPSNEVANDTHRKTIGYVLWIFGFTGSHRFYYGKPISGTIWFFTLGLLGIGWLIDLFLIPGMDRQADRRFVAGRIDYSIAWILQTFPRRSGPASVLHGQVDYRPALFVDRRAVPDRVDLRLLDAQSTDQRAQHSRAKHLIGDSFTKRRADPAGSILG